MTIIMARVISGSESFMGYHGKFAGGISRDLVVFTDCGVVCQGINAMAAIISFSRGQNSSYSLGLFEGMMLVVLVRAVDSLCGAIG